MRLNIVVARVPRFIWLRPCELLQHIDLREIGILKFVDQNKSSAGALTFEQSRICSQQLAGAQNLVPEGPQVPFTKHALDSFKDERDFAATAERFLFGKTVCVFRLADAGRRNFTALDALHILRVLLRPDQFIVTAANEIEKVIQEFGDVSRTDEIVQL